ncbi:MAG: CBS domain-containing protein [Actinobacteria bacterium]|nr:CBS domain-containing protein [Actinomycetota bacterium]
MGDPERKDENAYPFLEGKVDDVMATEPLFVVEDESIQKLIDIFIEYQFCGMPVVNSRGDLVGVVRDSDLVSIFARKEPTTVRSSKVKDIMHVPPFTITLGDTVQKAVSKMFSDGTRFLVVVDKNKDIAGVVTRIDLVKAIRFREDDS